MMPWWGKQATGLAETDADEFCSCAIQGHLSEVEASVQGRIQRVDVILVRIKSLETL